MKRRQRCQVSFLYSDRSDSCYQELAELTTLQTGRSKPVRRSDYELAERLGNVLYNTVSGGGSDFCPASARELIESLRMQLYRRASQKGAA